MSTRSLPLLLGCFACIVLAFAVGLTAAAPVVQEPQTEKTTTSESDQPIVVENATRSLTIPEGTRLPAASVAAIMSQDFEGAWPATGWQLIDSSTNDGGDYRWGKRNCHPRTGTYAGWSVGGGTQGSALGCGANYPNYVYTSASTAPLRSATQPAPASPFICGGSA